MLPAFYQMKLYSILILSFSLTLQSFAQNNDFSFDLFNANIENNVLTVRNKKNVLIYQKTFSHPCVDTADLDNDGINEFILIDSTANKSKFYYTIFIYNTIDSFYVADSINSGMMRPYRTFSKELKSTMIVTGNPKFDSFNSDTMDVYLPLNCWDYESGKVSDVNGSLYDFFIAENDTLLENMDSYLENEPKDCNTTLQLKAIIASIYVNYLQAGEKILARQFLHKYYFCKDVEIFKQKISSLL